MAGCQGRRGLHGTQPAGGEARDLPVQESGPVLTGHGGLIGGLQLSVDMAAVQHMSSQRMLQQRLQCILNLPESSSECTASGGTFPT
jgi:hypothetical protein